MTTILVLLALAAGPLPPMDALGGPLPDGALARLGSPKFLHDSISWPGLTPTAGPGGPVLSPDASFLVTATRAGIRISIPATDAPLRLFTYNGGVGGGHRMAISPDGSRALNFGVYYGRVGRHGIAIYNIRKGEFESSILGHGPRFAHSFSRDGGRLAVLESDNKATVWDLGRNLRLREFESYVGKMSAVALSPDGKSLAACIDTTRHVIHIWDVASGDKLASLEAELAYFQQAAFSPDGRTLATVQSGGRLTLWALATKKAAAEAWAPSREVAALRFTADGKKLAVAGADGVVGLHDAGTGKRLAVVKGPADVRLTGLAIRPDGKPLAVGTRFSRAVLWDAATGKLFWPDAGHAAPVQALAFRANGDLVSAAADGCRVWRAATWAEASSAPWPPPKDGAFETQRAFLSPDGRYAVWAGASGAELVGPDTGRGLGPLGGLLRRPGLPPLYAFSPDGRRLVKVSHPGVRPRTTQFQLWGLPGLRGRRDVEVNAEGYWVGGDQQAALSPEGSALAVTGCGAVDLGGGVARRRVVRRQATRAMVFGMRGGEKRAEFLMPLGGGLAWSPDGRLLAATDFNGGVRLLKADDGKELGAVPPPPEGANGIMAFSPCGRLLAAGVKGKGGVAVYELATATPRFLLKGDQEWVQSLAFSPDGRKLATGARDTTVLIWGLIGRGGGRPGADAWAALADKRAAPAFEAMSRLAGHPASAVALLRKHLKPAPGKALSDADTNAAIKGLAADEFETRQRSQKALTEAAVRLAPRLEKALRDADDLEVKERLKAILMAAPGWPRPDQARTVRAVEVLERVGTPAARKFLGELATGNPDARLTLEAKSALERLRRKP